MTQLALPLGGPRRDQDREEYLRAWEEFWEAARDPESPTRVTLQREVERLYQKWQKAKRT